MIAHLETILPKAERKKYAIPAFNVTNLETVLAVVNAAVTAQSAVIIQTSETALRYAGAKTLRNIIEHVAEERGAKIPIVIHLDHGKNFPIIKSTATLKFTSVHRDASELPYEQNIEETKKAVMFCRPKKISVQGELGQIPGKEGMRTLNKKSRLVLLTDPLVAHEFVSQTGIDTLAVSIGTAHGYFRGKEHIDLARLKEIKKRVFVPLVLHGGSGVAARELKSAIANGIRIINVDTALRLQFMHGLHMSFRSYNAKRGTVDIRTHLAQARVAMEKEILRIMKLFGCIGSAK